MIIQVDGRHVIEGREFKWTLRSRTHRGHAPPIRSAARPRMPSVIDCATLPHLSDCLAAHGLVAAGFARIGRDLPGIAVGIEAELRAKGVTAFTFGAGRFAVERGDGDYFLLMNPRRDVARLPLDKDRAGRRSYVGFYPTIRSALIAAVERVLQADPRTIDLSDLDALATDVASRLWSDVAPVTQRPEPLAVLCET